MEFQHKLINSASKSVLYAAVIARSKEEALQLETKLTNLPTVMSVDSMAKFLVGDQRRKMELVEKVKQEVANIRFPPVDPEPVQVDELSRTLWYLQGYLGLALEEVARNNKPDLLKSLAGLRQSIEKFRHIMLNADRREAAARLGAYQRALFEDLRETFHAIRTQDNSSPLTEEAFRRTCVLALLARTACIFSRSIPKRTSGSARPRKDL